MDSSLNSRGISSPVTISLTSGKGGVGKTSLAVNLAFALSQNRHRVLLIDGDLGLANVDVLLRMTVNKTIRDVLESGEDPLSTVVEVEPGFSVLPASSGVPNMLRLGTKEQRHIESVLRRIASGFDFVFVDTAAGIGPSVLWLNNFVDYNFVVVTPDPTSITDAYALIKVMAKEYQRDQFYVILNLVRDDQEGREVFSTIDNVAARFLDIRTQYLGAVPQDAEVSKAVREQVPFTKQNPHGKAARVIYQLAMRVESLAPGNIVTRRL